MPVSWPREVRLSDASEVLRRFESWDAIPVYAAWYGPSKSLVGRLLRRRERPIEVGTLTRDGLRVSLEMGPYGVVPSIDLSEPFRAMASQWPDDHGTSEVQLVLRQGNGEPLTLQFLLPTEALSEDWPVKEEHYPFLSPHHGLTLYRAVQELALLQGDASLPSLSHLPDDPELSALRGQRNAIRCKRCRSAAVTLLAVNAYHCTTCGREGGDGLARVLELERRRKIEVMHPDERWVVGVHDLERAQQASNILASNYKLFDMAPSPEAIRDAQIEGRIIDSLLERARWIFPEHQDTLARLEEAVDLPPLTGGVDPQAVTGGIGLSARRHTAAMLSVAGELEQLLSAVLSSEGALEGEAREHAHVRAVRRMLEGVETARFSERAARIEAARWHAAHAERWIQDEATLERLRGFEEREDVDIEALREAAQAAIESLTTE